MEAGRPAAVPSNAEHPAAQLQLHSPASLAATRHLQSEGARTALVGRADGVHEAPNRVPNLSDLRNLGKGVKPPLQFGERTQDCSPGQAGKEGPHIAMTGASHGFPQAAAPMGVFSRGTMGYSGSLLCGTREVSFPACGEGSVSLLWSHGRGIGHQETLKKDSPA